MKKVLIITDVDFWKAGAGHRTRIAVLVKYLSKHVSLFVAFLGDTQGFDNTLSDQFSCLLTSLGNKALHTQSQLGEGIRKLSKVHAFDYCIIEYIHNSYYGKFLSAKTKTILDTHDIISERSESLSLYNQADKLPVLLAREEYRIFNAYDYVMVICQPDFYKLHPRHLDCGLLLCPHPAEIRPNPIRRKPANIGFVGSEYFPNFEGINHFVSVCWDEFANDPNLKLSIYGNVANLLANKQLHSNIHLVGFTPDIEQVYSEIDIFINPVRMGAGLKIKNIEALSHGLPLITTAHCARGIEAGAEKCFLIADNDKMFKTGIKLLIDSYNDRVKLSNAALGFIDNNFTADYCFKPLMEVLKN